MVLLSGLWPARKPGGRKRGRWGQALSPLIHQTNSNEPPGPEQSHAIHSSSLLAQREAFDSQLSDGTKSLHTPLFLLPLSRLSPSSHIFHLPPFLQTSHSLSALCCILSPRKKDGNPLSRASKGGKGERFALLIEMGSKRGRERGNRERERERRTDRQSMWLNTVRTERRERQKPAAQ